MIQKLEQLAPTVDSARRGPVQRPAFDFSPWARLQPLDAPSPGEKPVEKVKSPYHLLERVAALLLTLLLLPVMVVVAFAIKIESPRGPVFFKQTRVGMNRRRRGADKGELAVDIPPGLPDRRRTSGEGQTFSIWKFRTMVPNAEAATGPVWATEHDPRITRIGSVLRHLRLDEVPQLINIVQGQMRLIGPRPERPEFVRKLVQDMPDYRRRLAIPPGITGLAQVEREYDASVSDVRTKIRYDVFYVENRCWLLDLKILLKTIDVVVRGRGAH
jgi:lipopolysaccharide/colanic/teichoic acid biosynthesis glycosyltransferase